MKIEEIMKEIKESAWVFFCPFFPYFTYIHAFDIHSLSKSPEVRSLPFKILDILELTCVHSHVLATVPIICGLQTEFCPLSLKPVSTAAKRGTKDTADSAHRSPSRYATSGFKLGGTGFRVPLITAYRFEGQEFAELAVVNCPNQPPESR